MSELISNSMELLIETWDDPGDYPSNAGQGPLPSYDYIDGIDGEASFHLTNTELEDIHDAIKCGDTSSELQDVLDDFITEHKCLPLGVRSVSRWDYQLQNTMLVITCSENAEIEEV
jgi:hypothetical protein